MATLTMNPAAQGRQAFYSKIRFENNPYVKDTPDYDAWARGWLAAETEDLNGWDYNQKARHLEEPYNH